MTPIRFAESVIPTDYGPLDVIVYKAADEEHLALVSGPKSGGASADAPWLVRVHSECWTGEVLRSHKCDCREQLDAALRMIAECKHGIVVYLRQEGRGIGLGNKIRAYALQDKGADTVEANHQLGFPADAREYGLAIELLKLLGLCHIRLMTNNPRKLDALEQAGVTIVERVPLESGRNPYNESYLATKAAKLGHLLGLP